MDAAPPADRTPTASAGGDPGSARLDLSVPNFSVPNFSVPNFSGSSVPVPGGVGATMADAGVPGPGAPTPDASTPDATVSGERVPPAAPRLRTIDLVWRYGLAILSEITQVTAMAAEGSERHWGAWATAGATTAAVVVGVLAVWLMRQRRRRPLRTALLQSGLTVLMGSFITFPPDWSLASLATRRRMREVLPAALFYLVCREVAAFNPLLGEPHDARGAPTQLVLMVLSVFEAALLVAVGFYRGARRDLVASLREQVQQAERAQELVALHAEAQERNRIAREMHDVVAHRISLVAMHAGALAYRSDLDPEQTREIATTIQENAAASLAELRSVLGQLRAPGAAPVGVLPDKPQPSLADVQTLVRDARGAGMLVDFRDDIVHPELLPAQTGRHAYRIVQEALTNARKHALGCRVTVQLAGAPGEELVLVVRNGLRPAPRNGEPRAGSLVPGSGAGLVGIHERAQMLGGLASTGVREDASGRFFEVEVRLPW